MPAGIRLTNECTSSHCQRLSSGLSTCFENTWKVKVWETQTVCQHLHTFPQLSAATALKLAAIGNQVSAHEVVPPWAMNGVLCVADCAVQHLSMPHGSGVSLDATCTQVTPLKRCVNLKSGIRFWHLTIVWLLSYNAVCHDLTSSLPDVHAQADCLTLPVTTSCR